MILQRWLFRVFAHIYVILYCKLKSSKPLMNSLYLITLDVATNVRKYEKYWTMKNRTTFKPKNAVIFQVPNTGICPKLNSSLWKPWFPKEKDHKSNDYSWLYNKSRWFHLKMRTFHNHDWIYTACDEELKLVYHPADI